MKRILLFVILCLSALVVFWTHPLKKEQLHKLDENSTHSQHVQYRIPTSNGKLTERTVVEQRQTTNLEITKGKGEPLSGTFDLKPSFLAAMNFTTEEASLIRLTLKPFFEEIRKAEQQHCSLINDVTNGDFYRITPYPEGAELLEGMRSALIEIIPDGRGNEMAQLIRKEGLISSFGYFTEEIFVHDIDFNGKTFAVVTRQSIDGAAGNVSSWTKQMSSEKVIERYPWFGTLK